MKYIIFVITLILSCSKETSKELQTYPYNSGLEVQEFQIEKKIKLFELTNFSNFNSDVFYDTQKYSLYLLLKSNSDLIHPIIQFDLKTSKYLEVGYTGKGPDEILNGRLINIKLDTIYVFDSDLSKITRYRLNSDENSMKLN